MAEGEKGADNADKKHDPSEKSLREAADRGQLPRSTELNAVVSLVAVTAALALAGGAVGGPIVEASRRVLAPGGPADLDLLGAQNLVLIMARAVLLSAGVPLVVAAAAAVVVGLAQTRFQIAPKAIEARLDVLDPMPRLRKLVFSRQALVELVKGLLHVFVLGAITVYTISERLDTLPSVAAEPPVGQLRLMRDLGVDLIVRALPVMGVLAIVDYAWSYYTWWQQLRRTDHQVREDHKEAEGDPMIRAQRRKRMRELTGRNAVRRLREATVLVTNPTHYAVGLRYRHGEDGAPIVVVKGADHLALRLRREAFNLGIPRIEDRMLARTLYAKVPAGHPIPSELYAAVAKVLAVIYKRRRQHVPARSGARRARPRPAAPPPAPRTGRIG